MTMTDDAAPAAGKERWTFQWKELYEEVITSGLCTGCAGCVISCPHDVIGYKHEPGQYKPFHLETELGHDNCVHGEKGCTSCTRACPRFRTWEHDADMHLFGKTRDDNAMYGQYRQLLLCRAADTETHDKGQDGGFVGAMLIWLLQHDYIDAALTSFLEGDGSSWKAKPGLARNREEEVRCPTQYADVLTDMEDITAKLAAATKMGMHHGINYTKQDIVEEVMRMRPTTTWVTREAAEDCDIDGIHVPKGTTIHLFTESSGDSCRANGRPRFLATVRSGFSAVADPLGMTWDLVDAGTPTRTLIMVSRLGHCLNDLLFRWKSGQLPMDIRIASERATFGLPEINVGRCGGGAHLGRLVPPGLLRLMVFTGERHFLH